MPPAARPNRANEFFQLLGPSAGGTERRPANLRGVVLSVACLVVARADARMTDLYMLRLASWKMGYEAEDKTRRSDDGLAKINNSHDDRFA